MSDLSEREPTYLRFNGMYFERLPVPPTITPGSAIARSAVEVVSTTDLRDLIEICASAVASEPFVVVRRVPYEAVLDSWPTATSREAVDHE
jgi:hypothetical protein